MHLSWERQGLGIVLEHPSFARVEPGSPLPVVAELEVEFLRPGDTEYDDEIVELTPAELAQNAKNRAYLKEIDLRLALSRCPHCDGTGNYQGLLEGGPCTLCGGTGKLGPDGEPAR